MKQRVVCRELRPNEQTYKVSQTLRLTTTSYARKLGLSDRLPVNVDHACGDHYYCCQGNSITDGVADSKRDRIFFQLAAVRQKPGSAEPVKNDWAQQKQKFGRRIEQAYVLAVNVETENNDGRKTAPNPKRKQKFAIAGTVATTGIACLDQVSRVERSEE